MKKTLLAILLLCGSFLTNHKAFGQETYNVISYQSDYRNFATSKPNVTASTFATVATSPTATTTAATSITATSAILNGTVNDNGATTITGFEYSTTSASLNSGLTIITTVDPAAIVAGKGSTAVSASITTTPSTTYYYRTTAASGVGYNTGSIKSFTSSPPTIAITPTTLPTGSAGVAYSQQLSASGGTAPYTYVLTSGTLPTGIVISSSGILSGTPTTAGTFNFTITTTDAAGSKGSRSFTVTITNTPTITQSGTFTSSFSTTYGGPSARQTFNLSGSNLTEGILVNPGAGFEVSSDSFQYSATLTVGTSGNLPQRQIYVRIAATTAVATSMSTNIQLTSNGAATQSLSLPLNNTIAKKLLIGTPDTKVKLYGAALPVFTIIYEGYANGDTNAIITQEATLTTTATMASDRGNAPITASGATAANYYFSYNQGTLYIDRVPLVITANDITTVYGEKSPPLTARYSGFVNGDSEATLYWKPVLTTDARSYSPLSGNPYYISPFSAFDDNYDITYNLGKLTMTTRPLTIRADTLNKIYGNEDPELTYEITAGTLVDANENFTGALTRNAGENVNAYTITQGTLVLNANYDLTYIPANLNVVPRHINVTAEEGYKYHGDVDPALAYVVSQGNLSGTDTFTGALTRDAGEDVNIYEITQGTLALSSNYDLSFTAGNFEIRSGKGTLTITANNLKKVYGTANPALTFTYSGFAEGDSEANLTSQPVISTTATPTSNVNSYPITISGAASDNYDIVYVPANLTITTSELAVSADPSTKVFGASDPVFTYAITSGSVVEGDTFSGALSRNPGEDISTYPITQGTLALNSNYALTYTGANFSITGTSTNKVLTITANNQSKIYGSDNPALTFSYSGFSGSDNQSSLTAQPLIMTSATTASGVNSYPITLSGAILPGYDIVYVPANLIVTKAVLTVIGDNKTRIFGAANPNFTLNYSGFVNGDNSSTLSSMALATTTADPTSSAGNYPITASGAQSPNYSFNYLDGILTIMPPPTTAPSSINTLSNLEINTGMLSPAFTPDTHSYAVTVPYTVTNLQFRPTYESTATLKIKDVTVFSGYWGLIQLYQGKNIFPIVVTAQDGISTNTYTVTVYRADPIILPATNILTPNGDGKNDNWVIPEIQLYPKNMVTIYDRAGRVVYQKAGYNNEWNGTLKGAPLNQGTYYYNVDLGPGLPKFKGFITILSSN